MDEISDIVEMPYIEGGPDFIYLSRMDPTQLKALAKILEKPVEWRKFRVTYQVTETGFCTVKGCFKLKHGTDEPHDRSL